MRSGAIVLAVPFCILSAVCLNCTPRKAPEPREEKPSASDTSLALPSFSIFQASRMWPLLEPEKPLSIEETRHLIEGAAQAAKEAAEAVEQEAAYQNARYSMVPIVLYKVRHLFDKDAWTEDEIRQGRAVSAFFAALFEQPALEITRNDPASFRAGLSAIKQWYTELCSDNRTLSLMIFTFDDGPFFGTPVEDASLAALPRVESAPIPGANAHIVLFRAEAQQEPMVCAVLADDGRPLPIVGLSGQPVGAIKNVRFTKEQPVQELEGFGYKISLVATWPYGDEYMHLYLDTALKIRFYYVSW